MKNETKSWADLAKDFEGSQPKIEVEMVVCSCGCECPRAMVMRASMGTCCPDCYDSMSD